MMKKLVWAMALGALVISADSMAAQCAVGGATCPKVKGVIRYVLDDNNYAEANLPRSADVGCTGANFMPNDQGAAAVGTVTVVGSPFVGTDMDKFCWRP